MRWPLLEPYALKGACTVLRGGGWGDPTSLPDRWKIPVMCLAVVLRLVLRLSPGPSNEAPIPGPGDHNGGRERPTMGSISPRLRRAARASLARALGSSDIARFGTRWSGGCRPWGVGGGGGGCGVCVGL